MSLISQTIDNLLDGVSQKPQHLRKPSQAEEQINGYSHPTLGMAMRPGSKHVAQLLTDPTGYDRPFIHTIERDTTERYYVIITEGDLKVFDAITGAEKQVYFPEGKAYFETPPTSVVAEFTQAPLIGEVWSWTKDYRFGAGNWQFVKRGSIFTEIRISEELPTLNPEWGFRVTASAPGGYDLCDYPITSDDYSVEATVRWSAFPVGNDLSLVVRGSMTTSDCYEVRVVNGTGQLQLQIIGGGLGATTPVDLPGTGSGVDYQLKLEVSTTGAGNVRLNAYWEGALIQTVLDSSGAKILSRGYAGYKVHGGGPGGSEIYPLIDNFTISASQTLDEALPLGAGSAFKACTVGDTTVFANTLKTIKKTTDKTADRVHEALIYIRQADYSTTYKVYVQNTPLSAVTLITFTTTDGTTAASRSQITSEYIAQQLTSLLTANATLTASNYAFTQYGSSIYVTRTDGNDFVLQATDGLTDSGILIVKNSVQRFEDLPFAARDGMILEVTGDPGSLYDNYWVVYDNDTVDGTFGVWRECPKPGEEYKLDVSTMPWILTRQADGTFTVGPAPWRDREVGDTTTNPFPSFVGKQVKEIFFHEGRLGFTSDENVILSQSADLFNFFRTSAKDLYDNDPVDVQAAFAKVTVWHSAVHWDNRLNLWSDNAQVVLEGDPVITPKSVRLSQRTAFDNSKAVAPRTVGERIFFSQLLNGRARVSECYIPQFTGQPTARDTTLETPSYLSGIPISMAGTDTPGLLAVLANSDRTAIYVHVYRWAVDTKVQSSWSKWTAPTGSTILAIDAVAGKLVLIVKRADGLFLETIDLGALDDATATTPLFIDRQLAYNAAGVSASFASGETTWTIPYEQASGLVVVRDSTGALIPTTQLSSTQVQTTGGAGDLTAVPVTIGVSYSLSYTLSRLYLRKLKGQDEVAETNGRLSLRYLKVFSTNTSKFTVTVSGVDRSPYTYTNSAGDAEYRVPILMRNDEVTITISALGPLACVITGLEWEAEYTTRNRRV